MGWLITAALAAASFYDIERNLDRLPARIPTHFNFAGQADRWGPLSSLWFTFAMQVLVSGLILLGPLLARWTPSLAHFGRRRLSNFSAEQRQRVMSLFTHMMAYLSILIAFGFHLLLHESMHAAVEPRHRIPVLWFLAFFLAGPLALLVYYLPRINRIANQG